MDWPLLIFGCIISALFIVGLWWHYRGLPLLLWGVLLLALLVVMHLPPRLRAEIMKPKE